MPATNGSPFNGMERLDAADVIVALDRELRCSEPMNPIATRGWCRSPACRISRHKSRQAWHSLKPPARFCTDRRFSCECEPVHTAARNFGAKSGCAVTVGTATRGRWDGWSYFQGAPTATLAGAAQSGGNGAHPTPQEIQTLRPG